MTQITKKLLSNNLQSLSYEKDVINDLSICLHSSFCPILNKKFRIVYNPQTNIAYDDMDIYNEMMLEDCLKSVEEQRLNILLKAFNIN